MARRWGGLSSRASAEKADTARRGFTITTSPTSMCSQACQSNTRASQSEDQGTEGHAEEGPWHGERRCRGGLGPAQRDLFGTYASLHADRLPCLRLLSACSRPWVNPTAFRSARRWHRKPRLRKVFVAIPPCPGGTNSRSLRLMLEALSLVAWFECTDTARPIWPRASGRCALSQAGLKWAG